MPGSDYAENASASSPSIIKYIDIRPIATRVEQRIKRFAETCNERIIVYWSGGKDSTTALLAARRALARDVPALFNLVPGQANMTVVARLARLLGYRIKFDYDDVEDGVVHIVMARYSFWDLIEKYGLPMNSVGRKKRWCCAKLKSEPTSKFFRKYGVKCVVSGAKATDSAWRRRTYSGVDDMLPVHRPSRGDTDVLVPLYDVPTSTVWSLLWYYDENVARELAAWYAVHPSSPDCMLCIVVSPSRFEAMARHAPPAFRARALRALRAVLPRLSPSSQTRRRAEAYVRVLTRLDGVGEDD